MIKPADWYDADYFERGLESGKSCYQNYRWVPELTIPMTMTIIDYLKIPRGAKILDYGCAKGYLVRSMELLGRPAWGLDTSPYAIENLHPNIGKCCFLLNGNIIMPRV